MYTVKLRRLNGKLFVWQCSTKVEATARLTVIMSKFPDVQIDHHKIDRTRSISGEDDHEWLVTEDNRPLMSEWSMPAMKEPYR